MLSLFSWYIIVKCLPFQAISPMSREKLCQAMKEVELNEVTDLYSKSEYGVWFMDSSYYTDCSAQAAQL